MGEHIGIRGTAIPGNSARDLFRRDPLLRKDRAGAYRYMVDLAKTWSALPLVSPIAAALPIKDLCERADGSFLVPGTGPTRAGGGVDFAAVDTADTYLTIPGSVVDTIAANNQNFMIAVWAKLPSVANYPSSVTNDLFAQILSFNTAGFTTVPELLSINLRGIASQPRIKFMRQTAINVADEFTSGILTDTILGQVCQIAFWRNAAGSGTSLRTALAGRVTMTGARGTNNAASLTGLSGRVGVLDWGSLASGWQATAKNNLRLYRCSVAALGLGALDPLTELEKDWVNNAARFS